MQESYLFSISSLKLFICCLFDDSHSDRYEVISHFGFDLHFPDDVLWGWAAHSPLATRAICFEVVPYVGCMRSSVVARWITVGVLVGGTSLPTLPHVLLQECCWAEQAPGITAVGMFVGKTGQGPRASRLVVPASANISTVEWDHKNGCHQCLSSQEESQLLPASLRGSPRSVIGCGLGTSQTTASTLELRAWEIFPMPFESRVLIFKARYFGSSASGAGPLGWGAQCGA